MIAVLLHHALGGDNTNRAEGSKRDYLNLVKKIKVYFYGCILKALEINLIAVVLE